MVEWEERFPLVYDPQERERARPILAEVRALVDRGESHPDGATIAALSRALDIAALYRVRLEGLIGSDDGNPLEHSIGSLRVRMASDLRQLDEGEHPDPDRLLRLVEDAYDELIELAGRLTEVVEEWATIRLHVENEVLKAESEERTEH